MMDISLIIINYNSKNYLKNCLKSCINQKTKYKFEVILIDDASTDNSLNNISEIKSKSLRIFKNKKNMGIEKTSNFGFNKAKGKFICRVDSDDLLEANYIETMLKNIKKEYTFLYSIYKEINKNRKVIGKKFYRTLIN